MLNNVKRQLEHICDKIRQIAEMLNSPETKENNFGMSITEQIIGLLGLKNNLIQNFVTQKPRVRCH